VVIVDAMSNAIDTKHVIHQTSWIDSESADDDIIDNMQRHRAYRSRPALAQQVVSADYTASKLVRCQPSFRQGAEAKKIAT
jgi:hypothetical protein